LVLLICTRDTFTPAEGVSVRWLEASADYILAADFWSRTDSPLAVETWREAHDRYRYSYAAVVLDGGIVAIAAFLPFSLHAWDVSAVKTDSGFRRKGYGKAVVSFVTASILARVPTATCVTRDDNVAMIRTAQGVGFREAAAEQADTIVRLQDAYFSHTRL
jgi:ribosomal protein S18 acetylase RimI-like enzyme